MRPPPGKKRSAPSRWVHHSKYRLAGYGLQGLISAMRWVPDRLLIPLSTCFAWLTYGLLYSYRARMEENIGVALGHRVATRMEKQALVWCVWKNFARGVLETATVLNFANDRIVRLVELQGEQYLRDALSHGRGVLALSAHLGGFTLIGARLAAAGYAFSVVVKHPGDEQFARLITRYRAQMGIQTISAKPRREAVRGILKALRENRIVLVVADEFKSGDVLVDFMGQRLPAPRGPATLALRTGAVTLPMFAIRQPNDSIVLMIGPSIKPVQMEDLEESIAATTALYTRHLEDVIGRYPEQWTWLGFPRPGRVKRSATPKPQTEARRSDGQQRVY